MSVRNINSLTDQISLEAGANVTITSQGNSLIISAAGVDLPDGAVTGSKISDGQVVKSINSLTDQVALEEGANVTIASQGNRLIISADDKGIPEGAVNTSKLANNAVTGGKIASDQVVKSINALRDDVNLAGGANVTIDKSGNTLTISAATGTRLDDAGSIAVLAQRLTNLQQLWMVVSGMEAGKEFDGIFTGKAVCLRGVFEVRTERFNTGSSYTPGDSVSPLAGVLNLNPIATTDYSQKYGEVLRHDSTRNTLDVSVLS